jgi:hypothetical protein
MRTATSAARNTSTHPSLLRRLALAAIACLLVAATASANPTRSDIVPGEVIVRYRATNAPAARRDPSASGGPVDVRRPPAATLALEARFGFREALPMVEPAAMASRRATMGGAAGTRTWLLRFDPANDAEEIARALARSPGVERAEPNFVGSLAGAPFAPSDPLYAARQAADFSIIGMEEAWSADQAALTASVTVAVIDSGVDPFHADLLGVLDVANSLNVQQGNAALFDDIGHGTRVAGLIGAAANNGEGIAGVAFGCRIISYDVADPLGQITAANVASAINAASAAGADAINMSLRFGALSFFLREACDDAAAAGALLVAAAGNEAQGDQPSYPASFASVVGVGALSDDGLARAAFSNFNGVEKTQVDIAAPGETLFSAIPGSQYNGEFGSGTSFAAPLVSGVAAIMKARNPLQSGDAIRAHLLATASDSIGDVFEPGGANPPRLLDAANAVATPMAPTLAIDGVVVDDPVSLDADNDGDGALDAGESATIRARLSVFGADAFNVAGALSTGSGDVSGLSGTPVAIGTALVGATVEVAFGPVSIADGALEQIASFTLALTADGGLAQALPFNLAIENEIDVSGVIVGDPTPFVFESGKTYRVAGPGTLFLEGQVTAEPGATIKVDPGVDIQVSAGCNFSAVGTAEAPVVFTRAGSRVAPTAPPTQSKYGPRNEPVDLGQYQQVRYVSISTGSDVTGNGTQANPWATPWHALDQINDASAGNVYAVLVAEGEYGGGVIQMKSHVHLFGGLIA